MGNQVSNEEVESNSKPNFLTPQQREEAMKKIIAALVHDEKCVYENCSDNMYVCYKCIQAMQHTRECTKQKKSQCPLCKQFFRICHKHAKTCPAEFCKVELHGIHEKIAKKNEEACIQEFGNLNIEKPILKPPVDKKAFLQQQKIGVIRKSLAKKIISQGGLTKVDPHQARKRRAAQMIQSTTNNESSIFEKENSSATSDSPAKRLNLGKENSVANIQALLEKLSTHEKVTEEEK